MMKLATSRSLSRVATFIFFSSALFHLWLYINETRKGEDLRQNGVVGSATVLKHFQTSPRGQDATKNYCLILSPKTDPDDLFDSETYCEARETLLSDYPPKSKISIFYSPNDPSNFVIGTSAEQDDGHPMLMLFSAGLYAVLFFIALGTHRRLRR